jgi:hypothetical protein
MTTSPNLQPVGFGRWVAFVGDSRVGTVQQLQGRRGFRLDLDNGRTITRQTRRQVLRWLDVVFCGGDD